MRSAGTSSKQQIKDTKNDQEFELDRVMKFCAVSDRPLHETRDALVVCRYGLIYSKESVIEALLARKQEKNNSLGKHVRSLKDLYAVRFQWNEETPVCPVTSRSLNGQIAAFALISDRSDIGVNVLSQHGIEQIGKDLEDEYGPIKRKIRLAPPPDELKAIRASIIAERNERKRAKRDRESSAECKPSPHKQSKH